MASWVHLYLPPPSKVHCNHSSTHLFMLNCEQMEDREYMFIFVSPSSKIRRRKWHPTPVPLPGKSHGWTRLVGYSPWGRKESDTTERLHFTLLCKSFEVSLDPITLFLFLFSITLGGGSKRILLQVMSKSVLPMFSSKSL